MHGITKKRTRARSERRRRLDDGDEHVAEKRRDNWEKTMHVSGLHACTLSNAPRACLEMFHRSKEACSPVVSRRLTSREAALAQRRQTAPGGTTPLQRRFSNML